MTLNNTSQVTEAVKAEIRSPEKWAAKLKRLGVGLTMGLFGVGIVAAAIFRLAGSPTVMLVIVLIGVGFVFFAGHIIATDFTRNAGKWLTGFIKDVVGALGGLLKKGGE